MITDEFRDYVVDLLIADALTTVGETFEDRIRHCADLAQSYIDDTDWYFEKVAGDVQQVFHDEFIDTSWPACPRHPGHPMWISEGWWSCDQDHVRIARLGELGKVKRDAG